ncbi:hypothetical protein NPIL_273041 [Nephila pilipes]|uniref:Uncharacterized protein n=1 Tax=Nephila pilipes TaxID=299642 RepID=A0A8X6U8I1_NEPPI|nr:hypothetical protein NPIL_273041 [Nephila pilipes]
MRYNRDNQRHMRKSTSQILSHGKISNKEENPVPTSVPCLWNKTSKKVDPISIAFMNFCRKRKCLKKTFKKISFAI